MGLSSSCGDTRSFALFKKMGEDIYGWKLKDVGGVLYKPDKSFLHESGGKPELHRHAVTGDEWVRCLFAGVRRK